MSWLVRDPESAPDRGELRVWLPAALTAHPPFQGRGAAAAARRLRYIVVDEIVDDGVGLTLTPWPYADAEGRLRFLDLDERAHVGVSVQVLRAQLYAGVRDRAPRVGDAFAAELASRAASRLVGATNDAPRWVKRLDTLLAGPVYDLTEEGRVVSKLAFYATSSRVLPERLARRWQLLEDA